MGAHFRVLDGGNIGGCLMIADQWVSSTMLNGGQDFLAWYAIAGQLPFPNSAAEAERHWKFLFGAGSLLPDERFAATKTDANGVVVQWGYFSPVKTDTGTHTQASYNYLKILDRNESRNGTALFVAGAGTRWQAYSR